jgi:cell division protein FtsZ
MTLSEVEILMKDLGKHIDDRTQILFGTSVDGRMGNRLSVTLISSIAVEDEEPVIAKPASPAKPHKAPKPEPAPQPKAVAPPPLPPAPIADEIETEQQEIEEEEEEEKVEPMIEVEATIEPPPAKEREIDLMHLEPVAEIQQNLSTAEPALEEPEPVIPTTPLAPRVILPKKKPIQHKEPKSIEDKRVHAKQEVMQFEPVTRGRFEKSEPTIVEGQDLDIPTFLRKNVRVK